MGSRGQQFFFLLSDFTGLTDDVDPNREEEFKNAVREKGIPEENILNFIYNGNGIIFFSLTIPFTWCVSIRKQINLFKMSSCTSNLFLRSIILKKGRKNVTLAMMGMLVIGGSFISPILFFPRQLSKGVRSSDSDTFVSKRGPLLTVTVPDEAIRSHCYFMCVKCLSQQFKHVTNEFFFPIILLLLSHIKLQTVWFINAEQLW